jgi:hypothetical protein
VNGQRNPAATFVLLTSMPGAVAKLSAKNEKVYDGTNAN